MGLCWYCCAYCEDSKHHGHWRGKGQRHVMQRGVEMLTKNMNAFYYIMYTKYLLCIKLLETYSNITSPPHLYVAHDLK